MKKIILLLIIGFNMNVVNSQIMFEKSYGGSNSEFGWGTTQLADQGFITVGSTNSFGAGSFDIYVTRTTETGGTVWNKTFGGPNDDFGTAIKRSSDNGYIITGYTNSFGNGGFDIYVIKIDINGNLVWSKTYGGTGDEMAYAVERYNSGCILTGKTSSAGSSYFDGFILALENDGSLSWFKNYGGINDECFTSIKSTVDHGFCLAGNTTSFGAGFQDAYVIKVDSVGNKEWSRVFGGADTDYSSTIEETYDGNFIVTGGTSSFGAGSGDAFVVKLDSIGNVIWQNTLGGNGFDSGNDIVEASDAGYVMIGHSASFTANNNVYLVKMDMQGNVEYSRSFGDTGSDIGYHIERTSDFGYIICGELNQKMYLMKLNESCKTLCANYEISQSNIASFQFISPTDNSGFNVNMVTGNPGEAIGFGGTSFAKCYFNNLPETMDAAILAPVDTGFVDPQNDDFIGKGSSESSENTLKNSQSSISSLNVYPNPNNGENVNISIKTGSSEEIVVVVYDQLGRENYSKIVVTGENQESFFAIDPTGKLSPGIYMVLATSGKSTLSRRLIVK